MQRLYGVKYKSRFPGKGGGFFVCDFLYYLKISNPFIRSKCLMFKVAIGIEYVTAVAPIRISAKLIWTNPAKSCNPRLIQMSSGIIIILKLSVSPCWRFKAMNLLICSQKLLIAGQQTTVQYPF
ncbi:MAG TPA: hypothetical protein DCR40_20700 [Prolixibacteraceae bacterium]|nr:hypothetical protein [Prolixibacteraceae bacterium]